MSKIGRPNILDDQKKRLICTIARMGGPISEAARLVGCCENTIRNAIRADEEFLLDLANAQAKAQFEYLKRIRRASKQSWRASAWLLTRLNPEKFGSSSERMAAKKHHEEVQQGAPPWLANFEETPPPRNHNPIRERIHAENLTGIDLARMIDEETRNELEQAQRDAQGPT